MKEELNTFTVKISKSSKKLLPSVGKFLKHRRITLFKTMPVEPIHIEAVQSFTNKIIIDVRSEGEFQHAHIPDAINVPIFNNAQRAEIGTAYKKQSRKKAVDIGLVYFNERQQHIYSTIIKLLDENPEATLIVHCARGGLRSGTVAWLLSLYGHTVKQLVGGYKLYRHWVLDTLNKKYQFKVLGGYTGSRKTKTLYTYINDTTEIIDLEKLAQHKGSAFGGITMPKQPSQEMFENLLAQELHDKQNKTIWLEDESQRLGLLRIPNNIWLQMRNEELCFLTLSFDNRLKNIINEYGTLPLQELIDAVVRIQKKLGGQNAKEVINNLQGNDIEKAFEILLKYYDKKYQHGMEKRASTITYLNT